MNIFILDHELAQNAIYHVDDHVKKISLEAAQMLCTARHLMGDDTARYKVVQPNNPVNKWVRASEMNYVWTCHYGLELCKEYTHRFSKKLFHEQVLWRCLETIPNGFKEKTMTPFHQGVYEENKHSDVVVAYRAYYNQAKRHLFTWTGRGRPDWITND